MQGDGGPCIPIQTQILVRPAAFVTLVVMRKSLFCFFFAMALPVIAAEIRINFADYPVGKLPDGFQSVLAGGGKSGDWQVVDDTIPSAFTPLTRQASGMTSHPSLAQLSDDPTDERFPMLVYNRETFEDFKLSTTFKIVAGGVEQMAGIVFHLQNETNFYVIRVSALGHNLRFYKVVNGVRSDPIGVGLDVSGGAWHKLAVQCQGNHYSFSLDDHLILFDGHPNIDDNTFGSGKVGYWTKSDSITHFGDTTISYTPRVPMAQALVDSIMQKYPRIVGLQVYALDGKNVPRVIGSKY